MVIEATEQALKTAAGYFSGMDDTVITSCLAGVMGRVFMTEGAAAAYLGVQRVPPQADVMNVAVSPALRRRGIARALFAELERRLPEIDELFLEVRASNSGAIALYRTLGFEQVGRRPNYYLDPREDALILRKELFHADPVR